MIALALLCGLVSQSPDLISAAMNAPISLGKKGAGSPATRDWTKAYKIGVTDPITVMYEESVFTLDRVVVDERAYLPRANEMFYLVVLNVQCDGANAVKFDKETLTIKAEAADGTITNASVPISLYSKALPVSPVDPPLVSFRSELAKGRRYRILVPIRIPRSSMPKAIMIERHWQGDAAPLRIEPTNFRNEAIKRTHEFRSSVLPMRSFAPVMMADFDLYLRTSSVESNLTDEAGKVMAKGPFLVCRMEAISRRDGAQIDYTSGNMQLVLNSGETVEPGTNFSNRFLHPNRFDQFRATVNRGGNVQFRVAFPFTGKLWDWKELRITPRIDGELAATFSIANQVVK